MTRRVGPEGRTPSPLENSWSSTVPVIVRHVGLERDPFLLTPALSPRRGSTIVRPAVDAERSDSSQDGIRFSLSPRERARVRGNGTAAWRPLFPWGSTSGYRPSAL